MNESQKKFIDSIAKGAVDGWKKYGVLPSITIAQAILESGWGKSGLTKASNNLFGIKAGGGWAGDTIDYPTKEYVNGQYIDVIATFRKYPSLDESMVDHGKFLNENPRYREIIGEEDYKTAAQGLQRAGYATAPNYAEVLVDIIQDYQLYNYDKAEQLPAANPLIFFRCFVSSGDKEKVEKILKNLSIPYGESTLTAITTEVSQGDFVVLKEYCMKECIPYDYQ